MQFALHRLASADALLGVTAIPSAAVPPELELSRAQRMRQADLNAPSRVGAPYPGPVLLVLNFGTHLRIVREALAFEPRADAESDLHEVSRCTLSRPVRVAGVTAPIASVVFVPLDGTPSSSLRRLLVVEATGAASLCAVDIAESADVWQPCDREDDDDDDDDEEDLLVAPVFRCCAAVHVDFRHAASTEYLNDIAPVKESGLLSTARCGSGLFAVSLVLPSDAAAAERVKNTQLTVCVYVVASQGEDSCSLGATSVILRSGGTTLSSSSSSSAAGAAGSSVAPPSVCCSFRNAKSVTLDAIVYSTLSLPVLVSASVDVGGLLFTSRAEGSLPSPNHRAETAWLLSPVTTAAFRFDPRRQRVAVVEAMWASASSRTLLLQTVDVGAPHETRHAVIDAALAVRNHSLSDAVVVRSSPRQQGADTDQSAACWLEGAVDVDSVERDVVVSTATLASALRSSNSTSSGEDSDDETEFLPSARLGCTTTAVQVLRDPGDPLRQLRVSLSWNERGIRKAALRTEEYRADATDPTEEAAVVVVRNTRRLGGADLCDRLRFFGRVTASTQCGGELVQAGFAADEGAEQGGLTIRRRTVASGGRPPLFDVVAAADATRVQHTDFAQRCLAVWCFSVPSSCTFFMLVQFAHTLSLYSFHEASGQLTERATRIGGDDLSVCHAMQHPQQPARILLVPAENLQLGFASLSLSSTAIGGGNGVALRRHTLAGAPSDASQRVVTVCSASSRSALLSFVSSGELLLCLPSDNEDGAIVLPVSRDDRHFLFDRLAIASAPAVPAASIAESKPVHSSFAVCASSSVAFGQVCVSTLFVFHADDGRAQPASAALAPMRLVSVAPLSSGGFVSSAAVQSIVAVPGDACCAWAVLSLDGSASAVVVAAASPSSSTGFERVGIAPPQSTAQLLPLGDGTVLLRGTGRTRHYLLSATQTALARERVALVPPTAGDINDGQTDLTTSSDCAVAATADGAWVVLLAGAAGLVVARTSKNERPARSPRPPRVISETYAVRAKGMSATCLLSLSVGNCAPQGSTRTATTQWSEDRCVVAGLTRRGGVAGGASLCVLPACAEEELAMVDLPPEAGFVTCACEVAASTEPHSSARVGVLGTSGGHIFVFAASRAVGERHPSLTILSVWTPHTANAPPPPPVLALCAGDARIDEGLFFASLRDAVAAFHLSARGSRDNAAAASSSAHDKSYCSIVQSATFDTLEQLKRSSEADANAGETSGAFVLRDIVSIDAIATSSRTHMLVCGSASAGACTLRYIAAGAVVRDQDHSDETTAPTRKRIGNNVPVTSRGAAAAPPGLLAPPQPRCALVLASADPTPSHLLHARWTARRHCRYPETLTYATIDTMRNVAWCRSGQKKRRRARRNSAKDAGVDDDADFSPARPTGSVAVANGRNNDDDDDDDDDDDHGHAANEVDNDNDGVFAVSPKKNSATSSPGRPAQASGSAAGGAGGSAGNSSSSRAIDRHQPTHLETPSTVAGGGARLPFSVAAVIALDVLRLAPVSRLVLGTDGVEEKPLAAHRCYALNPYASAQRLPDAVEWRVGVPSSLLHSGSSRCCDENEEEPAANFALCSPTGEVLSCSATTKDVTDVLLMLQRAMTRRFCEPDEHTHPASAAPITVATAPLSMLSPHRRAPCQHFMFGDVVAWWKRIDSNERTALLAAMLESFPALTAEQLEEIVRVGCVPTILLMS